ncbi:COG4648 family protein [Pseudocitrobacter cyperus]|uniref:DNA gyrase subunit B n=1 Tax=Pseudocitrobacter cyperus TaxID=3112843 RepID=A0ABV0HM06_9ENTR
MRLPLIRVATGAVLLAWPFLVWFGLAHNGLQWLLPALAVVLLLRLRQARHNAGPMRRVMQSVALAGLALCIASALLGTHQLLLYWPVAVNGIMLALFGSSLFSAMPLVERLARLQHPHLPAQGVRYTRRVTQIWCGFFIVNGSIALFTALYGSMPLWSAWNGMIAYLLMATLMAGEWLVRRRVIPREPI